MKTIIKRTVFTAGLLATLFAANPFASFYGPDVSDEVTAAEIPGEGTRADQIGWVYRRHNGWLQRRRWNYTKGYWVDKYWINVGPL